MATSTDVTLPRGTTPVFPDCCIVCLEKPDSTTKIVQHSQNPLAVFFAPFLWLFGWSRVQIPICRQCKPKFYVQRWGRTVICWIIVILAFTYAAPHFAAWEPNTRKIALAAICFLVAMPYIAYEVFFPRAFDTTAYSKTTTYEFKSQDLGLQFYALNKEAHPYVKVDVTIGD